MFDEHKRDINEAKGSSFLLQRVNPNGAASNVGITTSASVRDPKLVGYEIPREATKELREELERVVEERLSGEPTESEGAYERRKDVGHNLARRDMSAPYTEQDFIEEIFSGISYERAYSYVGDPGAAGSLGDPAGMKAVKNKISPKYAEYIWYDENEIPLDITEEEWQGPTLSAATRNRTRDALRTQKSERFDADLTQIDKNLDIEAMSAVGAGVSDKDIAIAQGAKDFINNNES